MKKKISFIVFFYLLISLIINFQNVIFFFFFKEKIWIHRVNSIEKLKEVSSNYPGFELDVVFDNYSQVFDVNHPPQKSINLSLKEYLNSTTLPLNNFIWIDFKNLNKNNFRNSVLKLNKICNELNIDKTKLIIESKSPEYLKKFNQKGFKTSFYLPRNLAGLNPKLRNKKIQLIQELTSKYKTTYLSTDKRDYKIIKKKFPNHKLLIWTFYFFNKKTINPYHLLYGLNNILHKCVILPNKNVTAVLFKYDAKHGNH